MFPTVRKFVYKKRKIGKVALKIGKFGKIEMKFRISSENHYTTVSINSSQVIYTALAVPSCLTCVITDQTGMIG